MADPRIKVFLDNHEIDSKAYDYLKYLIGLSYIDKLIDFLNPDNIGKTVSYGQLSDFFNSQTLPSGITEDLLKYTPKDSLNLSEKDKFSVFAANVGIRYWLTGTRQPILELTSELLARYKPGISAEKARDDFFYYKAFQRKCVSYRVCNRCTSSRSSL